MKLELFKRKSPEQVENEQRFAKFEATEKRLRAGGPYEPDDRLLIYTDCFYYSKVVGSTGENVTVVEDTGWGDRSPSFTMNKPDRYYNQFTRGKRWPLTKTLQYLLNDISSKQRFISPPEAAAQDPINQFQNQLVHGLECFYGKSSDYQALVLALVKIYQYPLRLFSEDGVSDGELHDDVLPKTGQLNLAEIRSNFQSQRGYNSFEEAEQRHFKNLRLGDQALVCLLDIIEEEHLAIPPEQDNVVVLRKK